MIIFSHTRWTLRNQSNHWSRYVYIQHLFFKVLVLKDIQGLQDSLRGSSPFILFWIFHMLPPSIEHFFIWSQTNVAICSHLNHLHPVYVYTIYFVSLPFQKCFRNILLSSTNNLNSLVDLCLFTLTSKLILCTLINLLSYVF